MSETPTNSSSEPRLGISHNSQSKQSIKSEKDTSTGDKVLNDCLQNSAYRFSACIDIVVIFLYIVIFNYSEIA